MIIFFEDGRLGNQLFQYSGLKKYFPNQNLIFFGCKDLKETFTVNSVNFFLLNKYNLIYLERFIFSLFKKILLFLADIKVLGKITHTTNKKFNIITSYGLLPGINLAHSIFFQHSYFINNINEFPPLKKKLLNQAESWLKSKNIFLYKDRLVFIHIRRGDYLFWPNHKFPAYLELSWYKKAMFKISKKISRPIFIIMSDDLLYVQKEFEESDSLFFSKNKTGVDLAIMQLCSHGILSPSTFAWWGSFFSRSKKMDKNNSYFIAPKFWVGHRNKKWFPKKFHTNWINYIK
jgi:hypothetical protein